MPDLFLSPGDSRRSQTVSLGNHSTDTALSAPVMATTPIPDGDHKMQWVLAHYPQQRRRKPLSY